MTMPKFEAVAWRYELKAGEYTFAEKRYFDEAYVQRVIALHTAEQLAGAYEAGKREASEYIEQVAFEKWLYDKCPSGDIESVQRQWLESYEYAELAGKMEQAAQINHLQMALADTEALEAETSARCLNQAAQIEKMREALTYYKDFHLLNPLDAIPGAAVAEKALSATPDQALEQFAEKVREQCAKACDAQADHPECPERAVYCAEAIRAIKELP